MTSTKIIMKLLLWNLIPAKYLELLPSLRLIPEKINSLNVISFTKKAPLKKVWNSFSSKPVNSLSDSS